MHGNVDEWCLDGRRDYGDEAVVDPVGPLDEGAPRAVRGGSWDGSAWLCRSAYRLASVPGYRYHSLGFRLVAGQERVRSRGPEARDGARA
jgi:formylglycine-generating enzyme required for sulfatase activity